MMRRSCNLRFRQPILDETKTTTIRTNPWPVGVPIMIFEWSGKPYRSKQLDIAPIIVTGSQSIDIAHTETGITYFDVIYRHDLWRTEGFTSQADMDDWFRPLVPLGQTITQNIMHFKLFKS